ncbi:MAG: hypothetical protein MAG795_00335 [Candidatus Woesearchaeota archaeon]|nr:hypothetical protein [Candidatus Woesearchaeota archaeon]
MFAIEAFKRLYPRKELKYDFKVKYSGRFKGYNANGSRKGNYLEFRLSKKWRPVDDEIKIGLVQELMIGLFKEKKNTYNMDLYNKFIQNLHISAPKNNIHPMLKKRFNIVNDKYFNGMLEIPNLVYGKTGKRTLGHYSFSTDTITISNRLNDLELIDYVLYHELLHKKLKFKHKNGRSYHHTREFKNWEKRFENYKEIEKRLKRC